MSSLRRVIDGTVPSCNCNDADGKIIIQRQHMISWADLEDKKD